MAAAAAAEEIVVSTATVGSASVGKTTMMTALARGSVAADGAEAPQSTVGVETACVRMTADGKSFKYNIFDTAGQERFMTITSSFLRGKDVIIATYSLANLDSIRDIHKTWLPKCLELCREHTQIVFVGNKLDLVPTGLTADHLGEGGSAHDGSTSEASPAGAVAFSGTLVGEGRPEALVEALRTMREEVDRQMAAHAVAPMFFETSATRGDNLAEFMAAVSVAVARGRIERGCDLRTGHGYEFEPVDLDRPKPGLLGWGFCGL